jgi:hypothetical protein
MPPYQTHSTVTTRTTATNPSLTPSLAKFLNIKTPSRTPLENLHTLPHHLTPLPITPSNISHPLHNLTPLSLSSPFFISDLPPSLFYRHTSFSFSSGEVMKLFSRGREQVRQLKIQYGKEVECPTRDWVVIMNECFEGLEEVTFCVEGEFGGLWRKCVRDAVREGVCSRGKKKGLVLRVESGEWSACERIGGGGKKKIDERCENWVKEMEKQGTGAAI